jgi:hypothetical protein
MMNRYGFKGAAADATKKTNTTNLYEALIDDSGIPELDSKFGAQVGPDLSAMGSQFLNDSKVPRRFGFGQGANMNLGVAAPLFLPNDMSIIQGG